jgi:hypothetical protein
VINERCKTASQVPIGGAPPCRPRHHLFEPTEIPDGPIFSDLGFTLIDGSDVPSELEGLCRKEDAMEKNTEQRDCAHPACTCKVSAGMKYCSDYCKKAPETELHCNCMHPDCKR